MDDARTTTASVTDRWGECCWTARDLIGERSAPLSHVQPATPDVTAAASPTAAAPPPEVEKTLPIFRWFVATPSAA